MAMANGTGHGPAARAGETIGRLARIARSPLLMLVKHAAALFAIGLLAGLATL